MRNNPMLFQQTVSAVLSNNVSNNNNIESTAIVNSRATRGAAQRTTKEDVIERQVPIESLSNINNRVGVRRSVLPPPTALAPILQQQQVAQLAPSVVPTNENTTAIVDGKNKRRTQNISRIPRNIFQMMLYFAMFKFFICA